MWPCLVQLGFGKAGWYSDDWIDNAFRCSTTQILPEFQNLAVGDTILMMPGVGFEVRAVDPNGSIVSLLEDGSMSWCLALFPTEDDCTRLVGRWRPRFEITPATFLMISLSEPGAVIMEQKMLRLIRDRAAAHRESAQ